MEAPGQVTPVHALLSWPCWSGVQVLQRCGRLPARRGCRKTEFQGLVRSCQTWRCRCRSSLLPRYSPTFSSFSFPLLPASRPSPFNREVRGLASKTDVRFTEISSHQEGQEGLIQSGRAQSHSHSLFLDSFVSFSLFPPSIRLHYTLICYLSACPSSARAPFCLF